MYTIKEASEKTGIPASTIRYYEKEGLLPEIKRSAGSRRMFDDKDIQWLMTVLCFLKTGMTLATIRRIVVLFMQGDASLEERREIMRQHKEALLIRRKELDEAMNLVEHKLELYETKIKQRISDNW